MQESSTTKAAGTAPAAVPTVATASNSAPPAATRSSTPTTAPTETSAAAAAAAPSTPTKQPSGTATASAVASAAGAQAAGSRGSVGNTAAHSPFSNSPTRGRSNSNAGSPGLAAPRAAGGAQRRLVMEENGGSTGALRDSSPGRVPPPDAAGFTFKCPDVQRVRDLIRILFGRDIRCAWLLMGYADPDTVCTHARTLTHACTPTQTCTHAYTHIRTHPHTYARTHARTHSFTQNHSLSQAYTCV